MKDVRRIGLIICASNFERHQNMIHAVHEALKSQGNAILYVFTNYGIYRDGMDFRHGEAADFALLTRMQLDGCILEANLGSDQLAEELAGRLRERQIPVVAINLEIPGIPSVYMSLMGAGMELMRHLIEDHGCERIALNVNEGNSVISKEMLDVYRSSLEEHHLPYRPEMVQVCPVSIEEGRKLPDRLRDSETGALPQAVICVHDVCAIGLCMEAEERGIRIPEDLLVCSLNYSQNSMIFRPDLTGADRMDQTAAGLACDLLGKMMDGETVPDITYYAGEISYGHSCGHDTDGESEKRQRAVLRRQAITKIEMGAHVSRMMRFNDSLEKAETLDDWADNMYATLTDMGCRGFFCCLNQSDLPFIASNREDHKTEESDPYDPIMTAVAGFSGRTGRIRNESFPIEKLAPVQPQPGDQLLVFPIHHTARSYGYMVFLNDNMPVDQYIYRIFQESLGDSINNLHQKMILKGHIQELDRRHMEDQMTGLFNRFALRRFAEHYSQGKAYTVAMIDMDGLKIINDTYGHQAGNNAICMIADALREVTGERDLVIRYGGDEFLILSENTDPQAWERIREKLNSLLRSSVEKQRLLYPVGVSMGYAVTDGTEPAGLDRQIELADERMYEDKKKRRMRREA